MKTRGASVNFEPVTAPAHAVTHNRRGVAPPSYLLPEQFRLGTIEVIDDRGEVSKAFAHKMPLRSARALKDPDYSPLWEGVLNLAAPSGSLDEYREAQSAIVKNWCSEYEKLTSLISGGEGHRVLRADIHLDEGYVRDGVPIYNAHAHIIVDRTNDRGRVIKLNPRDMRKVQSMSAEVSGLQRGKDARVTGDAHLSHHAYRALARTGRLRTQQQVQQADAERSVLVKERDRARDAEREARAAERVAKADAKELYGQLRKLMIASGIAKQQDYQDARQIKADIAKLADAIEFWREKAGDPPPRPTIPSSEIEPGDSHGSAEQRPRKRDDVAPLHQFLVGAVTLTGRTPAGREYAVRAMQKRLLDSHGKGLDVPLSRVIQGGVDGRAPGGDPGLRRGTAGRVAEPSMPLAEQRETHDIYMELYHSMKSVGRIADHVPAAEGLRAKAPAYPEAKRRSKADDREWLIAQLVEWKRRLAEAERLEAEAAGALRGRVRDAEAAVEEEKRERAADRTVRRRRQTYRPGFGGQGLGGADRFPFVELLREWDQQARCTAYKRRGEIWFVTTRSRVEVINQTDQSLVVALKVAAKKFSGRIEITGPREFRKRAARLAARLGVEVADADLQDIVQAEKAALARDSVQGHRGPQIEPPRSGPEPDDDEPEPPRGQSR